MIKRIINGILGALGLRLSRASAGFGYVPAKQTIDAAKAKGVSVCEYVEELWNQKGATQKVVDEMAPFCWKQPCERIVEIGPGTGRYMELIIKRASPKQYEYYEIDTAWAEWLSSNYGPVAVRQPADGCSLSQTADRSVDLVQAHGVFVHIAMLQSFEYFQEMIRVCKDNGHIVFDVFPVERFDEQTISQWLQYHERYPVILPAPSLIAFFEKRGCTLVHQFDNPYGHSYSRYFIFETTKTQRVGS